MLDRETRIAILQLRGQQHGIRAIARAVGVSRNAVREVLRSGSAEVPAVERERVAAEHAELIRELHRSCKGNRVRVHEELLERGIDIGYSTLTAFCRREEIGVKPKRPAGRYHFEPGEEMQHDTSPHDVEIGGRKRRLQCASLTLCYCRAVFVQLYPRFTRFECRLFLSRALQYFGGAAARCMVDNTSVVRAHGTGANMIPAPEMQALSQRFGFVFEAHEVGDANRSARVERNFDFIDNNFYPGRRFDSFADANEQAVAWCERVNARPRRALHDARPVDLLETERHALRPLPPYVPEVYEMHTRRVDVEGFVCLHTNRYSVPVALIGRQVRVRETGDAIRVYEGHRLVAEHAPIEPGARQRVMLDAHRHQPGRHRHKTRPPSVEEKVLRAAAPEIATLVDALRKRHGGLADRKLRRLHTLYIDHPTEAVVEAVRRANAFGLTDIGRIERLILKATGEVFFRLPDPTDDEGHDDG